MLYYLSLTRSFPVFNLLRLRVASLYHPFVDGNKRTASMAVMIFFALSCKQRFTIFDAKYQEIILEVAQGIVTKKEIAKFFRNSQHEK